MSGEKRNNKGVIIASIIVILFGALLWRGFYTSHSLTFSQDLPIPLTLKTSLFIGGDIMLDRNVRNLINRIGFDAFFLGIKELVGDADIAVANLEGPFTSYESVTASLVSKELRFTFDPSLVPKLSELGFDVFGLANNHTLNFGYEGIRMTREYLSRAGIKYYGEPNNAEEISTVVEKNGIKTALIGFHEFSYRNFDNIYAEIEYLRPLVDVIIVSPHWGPEYQFEPTEKMKKWAHEWIDSGADAVIGAHPHIIGAVEEYKGKRIYYSLGNFVFDQYFSEETMNGLGLIVDVEKIGDIVHLNYKEIPIRVDTKGVRVNSLDN